MPTVYALLPDAKPHFLDSAGDPLSGGKLFVYTAGSSTKATSYTESDGVTPNANPIVLNSRGETGSGVYVATGSYKLVLAPANDTDPPASAIWTRDDVEPINDVEDQAATEWATTGLTPTYVSATSFTLVGDQTTDHHAGRRFKATVSAGTVYGTIISAVFSSVTTVTVLNDSGSLDAGLSDVSLSFLRADNVSLPFGAVGIIQQVHTQTGAVATGTTVLPNDDTIPQNDEGDQYMTQAVTPQKSSNILVIDVVIHLANSASSNNIAAALFQDSTADALASMRAFTDTTNGNVALSFRHRMTAGTTSETTFKVRAGGSSAGTTTFNGGAGNRIHGGVMASSITITEVAA